MFEWHRRRACSSQMTEGELQKAATGEHRAPDQPKTETILETATASQRHWHISQLPDSALRFWISSQRLYSSGSAGVMAGSTTDSAMAGFHLGSVEAMSTVALAMLLALRVRR